MRKNGKVTLLPFIFLVAQYQAEGTKSAKDYLSFSANFALSARYLFYFLSKNKSFQHLPLPFLMPQEYNIFYKELALIGPF